LEEVLSSLSEAARKKIWENALNGTKDKDMAYGRQRDYEDDDNWNKCDEILKGSPVV
jgi:hypothetical protein